MFCLFFKCIYYMSITTGFLTTQSGSNKDLGTLFVAQNSSNNAIKSFTFNMSGNEVAFWFPSNSTTLNFETTGNYLLSLTSSSQESSDSDLYTYYIAITNDSQVVKQYIPGQNANSGLLFATPPIYANNGNKYNGIPTSYTTIFNVTQTGNYTVLCYNYDNDTQINIDVTITTFFLTPYI